MPEGQVLMQIVKQLSQPLAFAKLRDRAAELLGLGAIASAAAT
jgi:hypothetical protein